MSAMSSAEAGVSSDVALSAAGELIVGGSPVGASASTAGVFAVVSALSLVDAVGAAGSAERRRAVSALIAGWASAGCIGSGAVGSAAGPCAKPGYENASAKTARAAVAAEHVLIMGVMRC